MLFLVWLEYRGSPSLSLAVDIACVIALFSCGRQARVRTFFPPFPAKHFSTQIDRESFNSGDHGQWRIQNTAVLPFLVALDFVDRCHTIRIQSN